MDIYKNVYFNFDFEGCYKLIKINESYFWKRTSWGQNTDGVTWEMSKSRFNLINCKINNESYKLPESFFFIEGDI